MNLSLEDCERLMKGGKHYPLGVPGYNPETKEMYMESVMYLVAVKLKEAGAVPSQNFPTDHGKAGHKGDYLVYNHGNGKPFYFIMDIDEFELMYPEEKKTIVSRFKSFLKIT